MGVGGRVHKVFCEITEKNSKGNFKLKFECKKKKKIVIFFPKTTGFCDNV